MFRVYTWWIEGYYVNFVDYRWIEKRPLEWPFSAVCFSLREFVPRMNRRVRWGSCLWLSVPWSMSRIEKQMGFCISTTLDKLDWRIRLGRESFLILVQRKILGTASLPFRGSFCLWIVHMQREPVCQRAAVTRMKSDLWEISTLCSQNCCWWGAVEVRILQGEPAWLLHGWGGHLGTFILLCQG